MGEKRFICFLGFYCRYTEINSRRDATSIGHLDDRMKIALAAIPYEYCTI